MGLFNRLANFVTFGAVDRSEANRRIKDSEAWQERAKERLESQRSATKSSIEKLGTAKFVAFENSLVGFHNRCKRIGKSELSRLRISNSNFSAHDVKQINHEIGKQVVELKAIGVSVGGGIVAGSVAAGGTVFAVSAFGVAGTGTAIGSLSGVAATNATLAWLGGGSLATGGAGVVGGMAVLGGIALAPIAIFGMFMGASKGKQKLEKAKEFEAEVDLLVERIETLILELRLIGKASNTFTKVVVGVDKICQVLNEKLDPIIARLEARSIFKKIKDFISSRFLGKNFLLSDEILSFQNALQSAMVLKGLIDKPVMNEDGSYVQDCLDFVNGVKSQEDELKLLTQQ
jgi:hypothetical protein